MSAVKIIPQNIPNAKLPTFSEHTTFDQRPVLEDKQFGKRGNVVVHGQNPANGKIDGIPLIDIRTELGAGHFPRELRTTLVENILAGSGQSEFAQKLNSRRRDNLKSLSIHDLRQYVASRNHKNTLNFEDGIPKPLIKFLELLENGSILAPRIDPSLEKTSRGMLNAVKVAYALSGLPSIIHAYGISDFLLEEKGSIGKYLPPKPFRQPGVDYKSRTSIPVTTRIAWNRITGEALFAKKPFIPANMRCVTDTASARVAIKNGLCPIVSYTSTNASERVRVAEQFGQKAFITVRSRPAEIEVAREILKKGGNICIEMANAHYPNLKNIIQGLKREFPHSFIMVGNVGSPEGYWFAVACGADAVKIGRGPGAGCTTPEETGISPGQVKLAYEIAMTQAYLITFYGLDVPYILDGGLSTPGHCLVGSFLGAESFMMGSYFAVAKESPAERFADEHGNVFIKYFGEASKIAADLDNPHIRSGAKRATAQGIDGLLPEGGSMEEIIGRLVGGLQGGIADLYDRTLGRIIGSEFSLVRALLKTDGSRRETATRLNKNTGYRSVRSGRF